MQGRATSPLLFLEARGGDEAHEKRARPGSSDGRHHSGGPGSQSARGTQSGSNHAHHFRRATAKAKGQRAIRSAHCSGPKDGRDNAQRLRRPGDESVRPGSVAHENAVALSDHGRHDIGDARTPGQRQVTRPGETHDRAHRVTPCFTSQRTQAAMTSP